MTVDYYHYYTFKIVSTYYDVRLGQLESYQDEGPSEEDLVRVRKKRKR